MFENTKIRVTCHDSEWIQAAGENETMKNAKLLNRDVSENLAVYRINAVFGKDVAHFEGKRILGT